ncbi:MAG: hypothetical protein JWN02_493 [Acidobacteria bacterium]|nr:hypothetical protein [Acidobacteriota bacterium]
MTDLEPLATFPALVRAYVASVPEGRWRERPAAGGFAMVEQVWHLADLEHEGFGERIARLVRDAEPELPDFRGQQVARERQYVELEMAPALERFAAGRATNIERLRSLAPADWQRSGRQEGVGLVTLEQVVARMAEHDREHAGEIEALLRELAGSAVSSGAVDPGSTTS